MMSKGYVNKSRITSALEIKSHFELISSIGSRLCLTLKERDVKFDSFLLNDRIGPRSIKLRISSMAPSSEVIVENPAFSAHYTYNGKGYLFESEITSLVGSTAVANFPKTVLAIQRRKHQRIQPPREHPNTVDIDSGTKLCRLHDISPGGMTFYSGESMDVGRKLNTMRIVLPKGESVIIKRGVVRNKIPTGSNIAVKKYKYGVEFFEVAKKDQEKLTNYINTIK